MLYLHPGSKKYQDEEIEIPELGLNGEGALERARMYWGPGPCFDFEPPCFDIEAPCFDIPLPCEDIPAPCVDIPLPASDIYSGPAELTTDENIELLAAVDKQDRSLNSEKVLTKDHIIFEFRITREYRDKGHSTLGSFVITLKKDTADKNGIVLLKGFTMELIKGEYEIGYGIKNYPIPQGIYSGTVEPNYKKWGWVIKLNGVSDFGGILIHSGNYPWHSKGCILVGSKSLPDTRVLRKKDYAFWDLFRSLKMITNIKKDTEGQESGLTDMITESIKTKDKIRDVYNETYKKYSPTVLVIIEN